MPNTYDVVVLGGGAAGICASIEASAAGARVAVLEGARSYGGAAALSTGGCCIVDSPIQRAVGIRDSVEIALEDWISWGGPGVDTEWARFYIERSCADLFTWCESMGVRWERFVRRFEGNSVPRQHYPEGLGEGLMRPLYRKSLTLHVDWHFSSPATGLQVDGDRVTGVDAVANGSSSTLRTQSVVVATGGFVSGRDWLRQYLKYPGSDEFVSGGSPDAVGDGHRILSAVGADFVAMENFWIYPFGTPDYRNTTGKRGLEINGVESMIWVNALGNRFHDESKFSGRTGTARLLEQEGNSCWSIFDSAEVEKVRLGCDRDFAVNGVPISDRVQDFLWSSPYVWRANTIADLASAAGLPQAAVEQQVLAFNAWIAQGLENDPQFGRDLTQLRPIEQPPFIAIRQFPIVQKNFGGVRTDLQCRVMSPRGTPFEGLYAAGEVAGMAGGHINGAAGLEGTMLGPSLFSGRVAGREAASNAVRSRR